MIALALLAFGHWSACAPVYIPKYGSHEYYVDPVCSYYWIDDDRMPVSIALIVALAPQPQTEQPVVAAEIETKRRFADSYWISDSIDENGITWARQAWVETSPPFYVLGNPSDVNNIPLYQWIVLARWWQRRRSK